MRNLWVFLAGNCKKLSHYRAKFLKIQFKYSIFFLLFKNSWECHVKSSHFICNIILRTFNYDFQMESWYHIPKRSNLCKWIQKSWNRTKLSTNITHKRIPQKANWLIIYFTFHCHVRLLSANLEVVIIVGFLKCGWYFSVINLNLKKNYQILSVNI